MEFVPAGTLYEFIQDESNSIDSTLRLKIATDIAQAMKYLHSLTPPRLHADLKSPNILVREHWKML